MPASVVIDFGSERLTLLADRALHWPARESLILADVHLGKDASFRAAGVPVPAGNSSKDLARIEALLRETRARRLVILGDLVHSRASHHAELATTFWRWRAAHEKLEILLIRGNHDRQAGPPPANWQVEQVSEPFDAGPFIFAHQPQAPDQSHSESDRAAPDAGSEAVARARASARKSGSSEYLRTGVWGSTIAGKPVLCGHVHPTVAVRDFDGTFATLCCFVLDDRQLILPAFGSFTGGYKMSREPRRKIYAVVGKSVVALREEDAGVRQP